MTHSHKNINAKLAYIYELYRLSAVNTRYYGWRLAFTQRLNFWMEVGLAFGAGGTGATAWKALLEQPGSNLHYVSIGLAAMSATVAIVKPIIQLNKKVETYTRLFSGHNANFFALKDIVVAVSANHELTFAQEQQFASIKNRFRELATLDDPSPHQAKVDAFAVLVKQGIPDDTFWWEASEPADLARSRSAAKEPADRDVRVPRAIAVPTRARSAKKQDSTTGPAPDAVGVRN